MSDDAGSEPSAGANSAGGSDVPWAPFTLAVVSASLLAIGAFLLLDDTDPDGRFAFALRVIAGLGLALVAIWAVWSRRWLAATFAALLSSITPLAEGWAWVAILSVVLAVWAIAIVWNEIVSGRKW